MKLTKSNSKMQLAKISPQKKTPDFKTKEETWI